MADHVLQPRQRVARGVGVDRGQRAVVAGVHRLQHVEASAPRTSPMMMRSGRMRSALRTSARCVTSPLPSMLARPRLQPHHVRLPQLQLGRVLDGDDALAGGMKPDSTLSRVVLPLPVPPEIRMLTLALASAFEHSRHVRRQAAVCDQVVHASAA